MQTTINYIEAYRTWSIGQENTGNELVWRLTSVTKAAEYAPRIWEPKVPFVARCFGNSVHAIPFGRCDCGIYCYKSLEQCEYDGFSGKVAIWGKVVEGVRGYRAGEAYPLEISHGKCIRCSRQLPLIDLYFCARERLYTLKSSVDGPICSLHKLEKSPVHERRAGPFRPAMECLQPLAQAYDIELIPGKSIESTRPLRYYNTAMLARLFQIRDVGIISDVLRHYVGGHQKWQTWKVSRQTPGFYDAMRRLNRISHSDVKIENL